MWDARSRITWMDPGMSRGFSGGSEVDDRARWALSLGCWCDPGTTYRHESLYRTLQTLSCNQPDAVGDTYVFHWICVAMRQTPQGEGGIVLTPWCQTERACRSSSSEAVSRTSSRCHRKANSWDSGFINRLNNSGAAVVKLRKHPQLVSQHTHL